MTLKNPKSRPPCNGYSDWHEAVNELSRDNNEAHFASTLVESIGEFAKPLSYGHEGIRRARRTRAMANIS